MTTKPITGYRIKWSDNDPSKPTKVKISKKPPKMAAGQKRNKTMKTARLAKKWAERSK